MPDSRAHREISASAIGALKAQVERDRRLGREVIHAARKRMDQPSKSPLPIDITGSPQAARRHQEFQRDCYREFGAVAQSPFFARVEVTIEDRWGTESKNMLVTRARECGTIEGPRWNLISWTSPLSAQLLDKGPGTRVSYVAPRRRWTAKYVVGESGQFSHVVPQVIDARYWLRDGVFEFDHEEHLAQIENGLQLTPKAYEAASSIELGEIIVLADSTQREAMHLPFGAHVLVEGPPGSGKTSIGIMRIPCLIDQQWNELGLTQGENVPYHSPASMRVLVVNDEMTRYLDALTRSLGIQGVVVQSVSDFLRAYCRELGAIRGVVIREHPDLSKMKGLVEAKCAWIAGWQRNVVLQWSEHREVAMEAASELGQAGKTLIKEIDSWSKRVAEMRYSSGSMPRAINLAARVEAWRKQRLESGLGNDDVVAGGLHALRQALGVYQRAAWDHLAIAQWMFDSTEYRQLLKARGSSTEADAAWRSQVDASRAVCSRADLALAAWLGHITLAVDTDRPPLLGGRRSHWTHIVIDEAQDLSPVQAVTVPLLVDDRGSLTLVGDLRQNLAADGGLQHWGQLELRPKRAAFGVNYRQSWQLGEFVRSLHRELFGSDPIWVASHKREGPRPRVRAVVKKSDLVAAIAEEIRWARAVVTNATIAVLSLTLSAGARKRLASRLSEALSEELLEVHSHSSSSSGELVIRTDRVVVATIGDVKGLEFDGVVLCEPEHALDNAVNAAGSSVQNAVYVAASRAKQTLSFVMRYEPPWLNALADAGACERIGL